MQHFSPASGQEFNFFAEKFEHWKGWLATLVTDEQGNYFGADGTSKSIGNHTDLQLLLALRSKASVIVTTGATARSESYNPSRFAPIAVITRDQDSLANIPLIRNPGEHQHIYLNSAHEGPQAFSEYDQQLKDLGFASFLFEGGPSTLGHLLGSAVPVRLVLSIVNLSSSRISEPYANSLREILDKITPNSSLVLNDCFSVGQNIVTVWSSPKV